MSSWLAAASILVGGEQRQQFSFRRARAGWVVLVPQPRQFGSARGTLLLSPSA